MNTDIAYALRQLKLAQTWSRPSMILDCVQRAIDALERVAEQPYDSTAEAQTATAQAWEDHVRAGGD